MTPEQMTRWLIAGPVHEAGWRIVKGLPEGTDASVYALVWTAVHEVLVVLPDYPADLLPREHDGNCPCLADYRQRRPEGMTSR